MECKIRDISVNYKIKGKGKPVILIHGYSVDHRLMTGCMEPIFNSKNNYKRIYIDLPGMGKSESAEWITNADVMLDIIIEFIEKVIPDENFLLIGESYGGYLSRGVLCKISERVDGVLFICPVIIADNKERNIPEHIVLVKDDKLSDKVEPEDAQAFNSMTVVYTNKVLKRYKKEIMPGIKIADNQFLNRFQENGYEFSFDVDQVIKTFDKPALILLGRQDSSVGYRDAWSILEKFPRATFAILDKAGHNLQIEQEQVFNSLTNEWLVRVESS